MAPLDQLVAQQQAGGLDEHASPARHGITRIDHEVQEHLLELARVGVDGARLGVEGGGQLDVVADQAAQHLVHVRHDGVELEHLGGEDLAAAEREQLPGELRGAEAGVADLLDVLAAPVAGGRAIRSTSNRRPSLARWRTPVRTAPSSGRRANSCSNRPWSSTGRMSRMVRARNSASEYP